MNYGNLSQPEGLWLIDKPYEKSSFWVISQMRRLTNTKKIGHAGTLDPLATGLLLVLVGKTYTRQADSFLKQDKVYEVECKLGYTTETDDAEGEEVFVSDIKPSEAAIKKCITILTGEIDQVPPQYSAIKIGGRRAYKLARAGQNPEMPTRKAQIYCWEYVSYEYPYIKATVKVSSGTYVRSLVRDLGLLLGTGAYMSDLRRTQIGEYDISNAQTIQGLEKLASI